MGSSNNFKLLGEEEERNHPHPPPEIEMGVMGNVRVFNLMSDVLELYLPKVFQIFVKLVGGPAEADDNSAPPSGKARGGDQSTSNDISK